MKLHSFLNRPVLRPRTHRRRRMGRMPGLLALICIAASAAIKALHTTSVTALSIGTSLMVVLALAYAFAPRNAYRVGHAGTGMIEGVPLRTLLAHGAQREASGTHDAPARRPGPA